MSRIPILAALLALLLSGCQVVAPPRDRAQWTSTVHGVQVTWRLVNPGTLRTEHLPIVGVAQGGPLVQSCVVDIDVTLARRELARVAAHEYAHCAQGHYLIPLLSRPDLGAYYASLLEGWPETYARAYLAACGDSLLPLGWADMGTPMCAQAPHPLDVRAPWEAQP